MRLNLTDNFKSQGKVENHIIKLEGENLSVEGMNYSIIKADEIEITIKNIGDGHISIQGEGNVALCMPCDRCLCDVNVDVPLDFDLEAVEPDGFNEIDDEQELFMDGYELDCEALIHNELIMGLPMKVLCKDDCKGLCPVCGSNRNEGACGCDTFVPDPRMAAIQDIFNAINKEV